MKTQTRRTLFLAAGLALTTALAGAFTGTGSTTTDKAAVMPSALATLQPADQRRSFRARVLERVPAGSYRYLRVREEGSTREWWVATLALGGGSTAEMVTVRTMARSESFRSRRLGRTFSPLLFGFLTTTENNPH